MSFPELYVALDDSVLVLVRREGHTVDGVDFVEPGAVIYTFDSGLLRRMEMYAERALALRRCRDHRGGGPPPRRAAVALS